MKKRTLTALGAVLGSLLVVLGTQQAVVLTSAAWNDRVNFSAPVTSGTWASSTGPASLEFVPPSAVSAVSPGVIRHVIKIANQGVNPATISGMTLTVSRKETGQHPGDELPTVTGPWTMTGNSRTANVRTYTLTYNGAALNASNPTTADLSFESPVHCEPNNKALEMTVTVTSSAPAASANSTFTAVVSGGGC
ncbi:MAG: hypothetical protein ABIO33_04350 [Leifsonia sp.]